MSAIPTFLIVLSIATATGSSISFGIWRNLKKQLQQETKQKEPPTIKILLPTVEASLPPPPPPEPETPPPPKRYVTINGQEPPEPTSFFHTKKFRAIGISFAVLVGVASYFLIFA